MGSHPVDFVPFEELETPGGQPSRSLSWGAWAIWIGAICVGIGAIGLARVTTNLGVLAPGPFATGRDYVWRIWLRASYNLPLSGDSWFGGALVGLLCAIFLIALAAALHVALQDDVSDD